MKYSCLLSLLIVACSDQVSAPPKPAPVAPTTPTAPVAQPGPLADWLIVSSPIVRGSGTTAKSAAYVSLPSGHVNATDSVVITNPRTGSIVRPLVIAGGFDPVAIDAVLSDTVDVAVLEVPTAHVTHTLGTVPARTPLRLVRTDPVNASIGIALDASVLAVFSEPLNPAALSGGIRLSYIGQDVPASLAVDSSGTRVTLRPMTVFASGEPYDVEIGPALAGVTGATPSATVTVFFQTAPTGDTTAVSLVTGEWDATSWRFTDVNAPSIWDDPVVGWGPSAYYRLHLAVGAAGGGVGLPGSVLWRLTMHWQLGGADTGSADIRGTATIGTSWWLGRTTQSTWSQYACASASDCPLQDYHDFRLNGNVLTLTRRDSSLLYVDGISPPWPAREVLTLQRATP